MNRYLKLIQSVLGLFTGPARQLPARTQDGHVERSNRYFNADQWCQAFQQQKYRGYVFCPEDRRALVSLAARIVFAENGYPMGPAADRAAKVVGLVRESWLETALSRGLCAQEAFDLLRHPHQSPFFPDLRHFPRGWIDLDPELPAAILNGLRRAISRAPNKPVQNDIAHEALALFLDSGEVQGRWVNKADLKEQELQDELVKFLHAQGQDVLVEKPELPAASPASSCGT